MLIKSFFIIQIFEIVYWWANRITFISLLLDFQKQTPSISEDKCAQRTGTGANTETGSRTQAGARNGAGTGSETRARTGTGTRAITATSTGFEYRSGSGTGTSIRTRTVAKTEAGTVTQSRPGTGTGSKSGSGTGVQSKECSQTIMGLPIGWEKDVDDSGRTFFFNRNQQTVQWDPPCYTSTFNSGDFNFIFVIKNI